MIKTFLRDKIAKVVNRILDRASVDVQNPNSKDREESVAGKIQAVFKSEAERVLEKYNEKVTEVRGRRKTR
jgi:adenylate kinase family enzyme